MEVLKYNSDTIKYAVEILKSGGVVAHPADTCFGLAGDLTNQKALNKILNIKKRAEDNPMSIMISVPEQIHIEKYVKLDSFSRFVVDKIFPSPITIILPKGDSIPDFYFSNFTDIGLRVPMHNQTQDMLMAFNKPLITTSANISGGDLCFSHKTVLDIFKKKKYQPDLIIEGEFFKHDKASTIIKLEDKKIKILREGPITASQLESILGLQVIQ